MTQYSVDTDTRLKVNIALAATSVGLVQSLWSAPGSMDTKESGCSMRPEVRNESGEETAEELYA